MFETGKLYGYLENGGHDEFYGIFERFEETYMGQNQRFSVAVYAHTDADGKVHVRVSTHSVHNYYKIGQMPPESMERFRKLMSIAGWQEENGEWKEVLSVDTIRRHFEDVGNLSAREIQYLLDHAK